MVATPAQQRLDEMVNGDRPMSGFVKALRLPRPVRWEPGRVETRWTVDPEFFLGGDNPVLFGGYTSALVDQAAALATVSVLEEGEGWTTSDLRVSYFRPITGGEVHIDATVLHRSRRAIHVEIVLTRDDGKMAAKGTVVQTVFAARPPG